MTVVLTGATGFVGRQILRHLRERDCTVRAIVRDRSQLQGFTDDDGVECVETPDLFAEPQAGLEKLLAGGDILIHAAWYVEPGKWTSSPRNIDCLVGTLNIARAFATVGGQRFVGIGTCAEYDTAAELMTTATPLAPTNLYAACKASAHLVLSNLLKEDGPAFAWCRIFYLYGEGEDERRLVPYIRKQLAAGQEVLLSHGNQVRDFMDVSDAAEMVVDMALSRRQGAVNICSGVPVTVRELAERIADEYGRRDLLRFGAKPDNPFDPPRIVGVRDDA